MIQKDAEVKAAGNSSVTVSNDALTCDTTTDFAYSIVVGYANANSPISLVNNSTKKEIQAPNYPGQFCQAVSIGDNNQTVLIAMAPLGQQDNIIHLFTLASGTLTDTGTSVTLGPTNSSVEQLRVSPGSQSAVAMVVVPNGTSYTTQLISFTLPGLTPTGTVTLAEFNGSGLAIKPDGTEVFGRSGQNGATDKIEGFSFNGTTGVFGSTTATLTIPGISAFSGDFYQQALVVTPDGTELIAIEQDTNHTLGGPRTSLWDSTTGTLVDAHANTQGSFTSIQAALGPDITGPPAKATVTLSGLSQPYTGSPVAVTVTTNPADLSTSVTYSSPSYPASTTPPTDVGSYAVTATITDPSYTGSAKGTLVIKPANATVSLGSLAATYDGNTHAATATTMPSGLTINFTYNGKTALPVNAGTYTVVGTIDDPNYVGSATGTLVIAKATATVTLTQSSLTGTYTGKALAVTGTTSPTGLPLTFTYTQGGKMASPVNAGSYVVTATVDTGNEAGATTGTLTISPATATVKLSNLTQVVTGNPINPTATTIPPHLPVTFQHFVGGVPISSVDAPGTSTVVATVDSPNYTGSATGTLTITPVPPVVTSSPATSVTATSATLNGSINPKGFNTTVWYQYYYVTPSGTVTATTSEFSETGTATISFPDTITGLQPATVYHFQLVAQDGFFFPTGKLMTFTTLPIPQFANAPATPLLSATGVQVGFGVTPGGVATKVYFIYGTDPNNLNLSTPQVSVGAGKMQVVSSAFINGLAAGTTYYYEIVTVSAAGTFNSVEESFTTLGFDTSIVAKTGDTSNGSGGKYSAFSSPAINTGDGVAFLAELANSTSPKITSANNLGIWANQGTDTLELIAQTGGAAPDTSATFSGFVDSPLYNDSNAVAFGALLKVAAGQATGATNAGIWSTSSGTLRLVAREGDAANGGSKFLQLLGLGLTGTKTVIVSTMATGNGVTASNNEGIWEGTLESNLALKIRTGDVVGDKTIAAPLVLSSSQKLLEGQTRAYASNSGDLAVLANFTDMTNGIVTNFNGTEALAHKPGEIAAGTGGATFSKFSVPIINTSDHYAFEATLASASGVTSANNAGIWADVGTGTLQLVARTGETPNHLLTLSDPLDNANDMIAFAGTYKVGSAMITGLFQSSSGTTSLVAQTGDQAPGCPDGVKFGAFELMALPDNGGASNTGGLVFEATLTGSGVTSANNTGIWAVDTNGHLQLIVRTGETINVAADGSPAVYKTISALQFSTFQSATLGQTAGVATNGDLTYAATFTDKTGAVFAVQFP